MVISDTHNDTDATEEALKIFDAEKFDQLFVLGDIGSDVITLLNPYHAKILAVKGNNDEYDDIESYARFPVPYLNFAYAFGKFIVLTHGHYYNEYTYDQNYDIFLEGHTHRSKIIERPDGKIIANPGSLSLPADDNASYIEMDEKGIRVKDIHTGEIVHWLDF
jgi:putative phosphoesterase